MNMSSKYPQTRNLIGCLAICAAALWAPTAQTGQPDPAGDHGRPAGRRERCTVQTEHGRPANYVRRHGAVQHGDSTGITTAR